MLQTFVKNHVLETLFEESVLVSKMKYKSKDIIYISVHHVGVEEYFDNIAKIISDYKKSGYVLFYEYINFIDIELEEQKKIRKMFGVYPSKEGYEYIVPDDHKLTVQNNKEFLGIENNKDYNIDFTAERLISEYEKEFGEIMFNEEDTKPIPLPIKSKLTESNVSEIVVNLRTKYLANRIKNSIHDKIIVLYGTRHRDKLESELSS